MSLAGILLALAVLVWLAYRGWSVLLLAPGAAMLAAFFSHEPLLAHWTQTFMSNAADFLAQFFPLFLLGALFGKLMDDCGSVRALAAVMTARLGPRRAILAVVLAGAMVTYGGVSLFVAFFVLAPMATELFRKANIPRRLMPAAIALGTSTFTMSALPGSPAIQNAIPMPFFGTTPFAAPGLGVIAAAIMFAFGLWWLQREEVRLAREGGRDAVFDVPAQLLRTAPADPEVSIHLADDPAVKATGRVREVAAQADPVTRTFQVKVGLTDPPEAMRLGASVTGRFSVDAGALIELPATALTRAFGEPSVWIVDPENMTVSPRAIGIERFDPAAVAVSEGLDVGDVVVTAGVQALHPGQRVRFLGSKL